MERREINELRRSERRPDMCIYIVVGILWLARPPREMPPHKRRRTCPPRGASAPDASANPALPADLLVEIVARSDAATILRCSAAGKLLRREILSPEFIRRVCRRTPDGAVPARLLGFLGETFSPVHPATPAAASFAEKHLAPSVSTRATAGLLDEFSFVTSRGGLVVLERRDVGRRWRSAMCVYDPMTGARAFFRHPPNIIRNPFIGAIYTYVVLTAADGIGCAFILLAADMSRLVDCSTFIGVQTVSSDAGGKWAPVNHVSHRGPHWSRPVNEYNSAVVLDGVVHWLMYIHDYILTYKVGTGTAGSIELPSDCRHVANWKASKSMLGSSPDGRLTLLFATSSECSFGCGQEEDPAGAGSGTRR
ncbi:hypothetical protein ACP70R_025786 [Stipagrostis hirtigluma subsp. patula]